MMERAIKAKELFLSGNNCAQSVMLSFADDLHYSKELAMKVAAGFGGGMGKIQLTCGAVTGAAMVLGIIQGEKVNDNEALKSSSYASVKKLFDEFSRSKGSTSCRELTGCDLNTAEGAEKFREDKIMEGTCAGCVEEAVRIVEKLAVD
jgi:C_GCAxxG_C_C family probable redox protein